jgi:hypothetical protein
MEPKIAVLGLAEFSRSLRRVDAEAAKELRVVFNDAAELVLGFARPRIPRITGNAMSSLKKRSTRTAVRISFGGDRAPYYPWLDFGGRVGRKRSIARPFFPDGRYVYVGYHEKRDEIIKAMEEGIARVARSAGLEVD